MRLLCHDSSLEWLKSVSLCPCWFYRARLRGHCLGSGPSRCHCAQRAPLSPWQVSPVQSSLFQSGSLCVWASSCLLVRLYSDSLSLSGVDRGGVYSPGAAFKKTNLIHRLHKHGISFSVRNQSRPPPLDAPPAWGDAWPLIQPTQKSTTVNLCVGSGVSLRGILYRCGVVNFTTVAAALK